MDKDLGHVLEAWSDGREPDTGQLQPCSSGKNSNVNFNIIVAPIIFSYDFVSGPGRYFHVLHLRISDAAVWESCVRLSSKFNSYALDNVNRVQRV